MTSRVTCPVCKMRPQPHRYDAHAAWCHSIDITALPARIEAGLSVRVLATEVGVSPGMMHRWAAAVGIKWPQNGKCPTPTGGRVRCPKCRAKCYRAHFDAHWQRCSRIPDEAKLQQMVASGMSQRQVAESIGASDSWLQRALKRLGYTVEWSKCCEAVEPPEDWRVSLCGKARGQTCLEGRIIGRVPKCPAFKVCQLTSRLDPPWSPCEAPDDLQVGVLIEACLRMPGFTILLEHIGSDLRPLVVAGWALVLERTGG